MRNSYFMTKLSIETAKRKIKANSYFIWFGYYNR